MKKGFLYVFALSALPLALGGITKTVALHADEAPAEEVALSAIREFNDKFDVMVDDFSGETLAGTNTAGVVVNNHLRVNVDSTAEVFPSTTDASIYKMATGVYPIETYDGIGFRIRKVGEGTLDLSNLVLALRGDDSFKVYELQLSEAVNPDGEALSALTSEYQDIIVSPGQSIDDDQTVYELASGGASTTKVLDKILGFHLYAKGTCSGTIEIENVFITKAGAKTVLDTFGRERVNKADDTCWWRDSTGSIVRKGIELNSGASYKTAAIDQLGDFENVALTITGDPSGLSIAPVAGEVVGTPVAWNALKDNNDVALNVGAGYQTAVVNFAKSGLDMTGATALQISSTTDVTVTKIFLTNMSDREAVTKFPELDPQSFVVFDDFNRLQSGFDGDYDKSAANPKVTGAGLYYALSYNNGDKVEIKDGAATFDATDLGNGYINFKEGGPGYTNQHYLVLAVKGTDGATLDGFRFDVGNGVVWAKDMVSAYGLPLPKLDDAAYPYTTTDGYKWLIIDLAESKMAATGEMIDFYYSGAGKLSIDAAFFADEVGRYPSYVETEVQKQENISVAGYNYAQGFTCADKLAKISFTADEGVTLASLRIEGADGAKWFKDGAIKDVEGNAIDGTQELNGLTIVVDLAASGLNVGGWNHLHAGDDGLTGTFSYTVKNLHDPALDAFVETEVQKQENISVAGYNYAQGFTCADKLAKISFTADEGVTLASLRIEGADGAKWFKDGAIKDADGNAIDGTQALNNLTIVVDLEASGLNVGAWNHLHAGDDGLTGKFSYTVKNMHNKADDIYEFIKVNEVTDVSVAGYNYAQGFTSNDKVVRMTFTADEGVTLASLRIEGADGAKWFKDGAVKDADGNAIDGTQALNGLSILVNLEASGLNVGAWNHLHAGDDGLTGKFSVVVEAMHEIEPDYATIMSGLTQRTQEVVQPEQPEQPDQPGTSDTPSEEPSATPSEEPSVTPSEEPSVTPSQEPSVAPSSTVSEAPQQSAPTSADTQPETPVKKGCFGSASAFGIGLLGLFGVLFLSKKRKEEE